MQLLFYNLKCVIGESSTYLKKKQTIHPITYQSQFYKQKQKTNEGKINSLGHVLICQIARQNNAGQRGFNLLIKFQNFHSMKYTTFFFYFLETKSVSCFKYDKEKNCFPQQFCAGTFEDEVRYNFYFPRYIFNVCINGFLMTLTFMICSILRV